MKKVLRSALLGTAVGAMGFVACDAAPPPKPTVPAPVSPEAIPPSATLGDLVRTSLADIVRDSDPYAQARRLGTLLPTLGPDSVPAVKQTLNDLRVDLRSTELELLVRFWATYEPEAAARWALRESPMNFRPTSIYAALSTWAQADPKKAIEVTLDWADIPTLESVVPIALVRGWYNQGDPPELRKYLRSMTADILGQRALAAYVRAVIETQGSEAVKSWVESLPEGNPDDKSYKLMVFRRTVDSLSQIDVPAAVRWCDKHCYGPYGADMRSLIGRNWAWYDAPASLAWLSTTRPGTERNLAVRLTYALWSRNEREAAMAWMADQIQKGGGEAPEWLHSSYAVYAKLLSGGKPQEALEIATRIPDEGERENVTIGILRVWRSTDEAGAETWMQQKSLPAEMREQVRNPVKEAPQPSQ